jgi:hypothetical protein
LEIFDGGNRMQVDLPVHLDEGYGHRPKPIQQLLNEAHVGGMVVPFCPPCFLSAPLSSLTALPAGATERVTASGWPSENRALPWHRVLGRIQPLPFGGHAIWLSSIVAVSLSVAELQ